MKRRELLHAAAGSAIGGISLSSRSADTTHQGEVEGRKLHFVLVHGAWHGGWCWAPVKALIEAQGHQATTPTLTGLGERVHLLSPSTGLDTHIEDVVQHIFFEGLYDIVLVGHSYSGMVITGVADRIKSRIAKIVYLDAAVPENGESFGSQTPGASPELVEKKEEGYRSLSSDGLSMRVVPPSVLGIPASDQRNTAWVSKYLTPHPLKTWLDKIKLENSGAQGIDRSYIHCNQPPLESASFAAIYKELSADTDWDTYILDSGHDAMVTAPDKLTSLLLQIAGAVPVRA